jgi:hypothetical protein
VLHNIDLCPKQNLKPFTPQTTATQGVGNAHPSLHNGAMQCFAFIHDGWKNKKFEKTLMTKP